MFGLAGPSFARSYGAGCDVLGTVGYVYLTSGGGNSGIITTINGNVCILETAPTSDYAPMAVLLGIAMANGKPAKVGTFLNTVSVTFQ